MNKCWKNNIPFFLCPFLFWHLSWKIYTRFFFYKQPIFWDTLSVAYFFGKNRYSSCLDGCLNWNVRFHILASNPLVNIILRIFDLFCFIFSQLNQNRHLRQSIVLPLKNRFRYSILVVAYGIQNFSTGRISVAYFSPKSQ